MILKTEDLKAAHAKSENSKYAFLYAGCPDIVLLIKRAVNSQLNKTIENSNLINTAKQLV